MFIVHDYGCISNIKQSKCKFIALFRVLKIYNFRDLCILHSLKIKVITLLLILPILLCNDRNMISQFCQFPIVSILSFGYKKLFNSFFLIHRCVMLGENILHYVMIIWPHSSLPMNNAGREKSAEALPDPEVKQKTFSVSNIRMVRTNMDN